MTERTVSEKWLIAISPLGWVLVWAFWLACTHQFHPTFELALIVTTSLVIAFALASYCNHLLLVPWLLEGNKPWQYAFWLAGAMSILTALALALIRLAYFRALGPDADPYGLYKHFAIDLFGMMVHVVAAAIVVKLVGRFEGRGLW